MKSSLNIGVAQWDIKNGDPEYNINKLRQLAAVAKSREADLLLVPEMWYIGYDYKNFKKYGSDLSSGAFMVLSETAKEFNLAICGTSVRQKTNSFYNTMTFFDQSGDLVSAYDKIFLFGPMGEKDNFKSGNTIPVCEWQNWKIGMAICYDLRFPELFRQEINNGAHLFVISAQWPITRISHWELLLQARAVENQSFVAGCNRIGENDPYEFCGRSAIIEPGGKTVVKTPNKQGVWIGKIDMQDLLSYRKNLPFLEDRREELFLQTMDHGRWTMEEEKTE